MALPNPVQAPLSPIVRSTPDQRVAEFQKNANSIYNKLSPYDASTGGIGFSQPFVYTKLTDSNLAKNLTKYDTQALPIGSTIRDVQRVGKFMASGQGIIFLGKQFLLQNQNAFNETRVYNPLSVLKATARTGTLGLVGNPVRYVETGGGLLNFFKNSLLSTIGAQANQLNQKEIDGTAKGDKPDYASARGGFRAGLLRYNTALSATSRFVVTWPSMALGTGTPSNDGTGFLGKIASTLTNTLSKAIPSTNPQGILGGKPTNEWEYRPEYPMQRAGIYTAFLEDPARMLRVIRPISTEFYNQQVSTGTSTAKTDEIQVRAFHKYYPETKVPNTPAKLYAPKTAFTGNEPEVGADGANLAKKFKDMLASFEPQKNTPAQQRRSQEMYTDVKDDKLHSYPTYADIPDSKKNNQTFQQKMLANKLSWNVKSFAGASGSNQPDAINSLGVIPGNRNRVPDELTLNENQSKDIVFFHFFDLVNNVYLPFRATISALGDQTSVDWEEVSYIGRADKLYMYKGFSRDVNISFTVYANSIKELVPMWGRINYLVGLGRPSKYTADDKSDLSSRFMYPPMVTLRLGDLFNDQPCVITNISITIPEDANWETFRADGRYEYTPSLANVIKVTGDGLKSRQLPLKADISVAMKVMEKTISSTTGNHFGHNDGLYYLPPLPPVPAPFPPPNRLTVPAISAQNTVAQQQELLQEEAIANRAFSSDTNFGNTPSNFSFTR